MDDTKKLAEQKITSEEVFNGRLLHVFLDDARLPNGKQATREWIKHPGAAAVLPVFENEEVMLVKQFRYPLQKIFYEVAAGKIDTGEAPQTTAVRELKEETGLTCQNLHYLGVFHPSIGYTDEVIHLYTGWGIEQEQQKTDADEFLINMRIPFKDAVEMVHQGTITDGKTMVTLLRAWHWWQEQQGE